MNAIRIVLVDNNDRYRTSLASLLAHDTRVTVIAEAESGPQAMALVEQLQPDLVLVDVVMSGMSGIELTRQLKALSLSPQIIVLTMHIAPAYRAAALAAGADDFLAKDEVTVALAPAIQRLFSAALPSRSLAHDSAHSAAEPGSPT